MRECVFVEHLKSCHTFMLADFEQQFNPGFRKVSAVFKKKARL